MLIKTINNRSQILPHPALTHDTHDQADYQEKRLYNATSSGVDIIDYHDILYARASSNYTYIITMSGKKYCISKVLKYICSRIHDDRFLRCHQSYLINTDFIDQINKKKGAYRLIMKDGEHVSVSRKYKVDFVSWVNGKKL